MPDPIFEVLMNGTVAAEQAGQIALNDAETLRREMQEAAALEEYGGREAPVERNRLLKAHKTAHIRIKRERVILFGSCFIVESETESFRVLARIMGYLLLDRSPFLISERKLA